MIVGGVTMGYLKIIKEWLNNYTRSQETLIQKKIRYKAIEVSIPGEPIQYDREKLSKTNVIHSEVESKAILLAELSKDIEKIESAQKFIDLALTKLNPIEKQVLEHRYINSDYMTWREVSERVNRTERQCISIRNRAVEKIERELFK
jgi:RinA family phage transcriptional activator